MSDVQCSDSCSDDEMLDGASQYHELPLSLHTVDAADGVSSQPDHNFPPVSRNSTACPCPASSNDLEGDDDSVFASRVQFPAGEQQTVLAASPEDVTPTIGTGVLARIENIFEAMADVLLNERGQLSVELVTRPRVGRRNIDLMGSTPPQGIAVQRLCFPGKTEREAWRFGETIRPQRHVRPLTMNSRCDSHPGTRARSSAQRCCVIETVPLKRSRPMKFTN
jgi:hypothetical protein